MASLTGVRLTSGGFGECRDYLPPCEGGHPSVHLVHANPWMQTVAMRVTPRLRPRSLAGQLFAVQAVLIAAVVGGLTVRNRRPGDRLRPVGLGGRKKLQDVLVDRKVKRSERDTVPIVTDASDRIVWVAGHVLSEEFRVTERTKGVIILKLRRV